MRAFARGGCQTLGLRVGRLCSSHGRPFLWDGLRYPAAYLARKTQGPFPGSPEGAQSIDRVSGGCEHLLAEGVRHWASVSAACVLLTGGPFFGMAYVTRLPTSPGRPRDRFRVHPLLR